MNFSAVYKNFKDSGRVPKKSKGNDEIQKVVKELSNFEYDTRYLGYVLQLLNVQEYKNLYTFLKKSWRKYKSPRTVNEDEDEDESSTPTKTPTKAEISIDQSKLIKVVFNSIKTTELVNIYDLEKLKSVFSRDCLKFLKRFKDDPKNRDFLYQGLHKYFEYFTITRFEYKQKFYEKKN